MAIGAFSVFVAAFPAVALEFEKPARIGVLTLSWGPSPGAVGLRRGLTELGYRENEDFVIGIRFTQGDMAALVAGVTRACWAEEKDVAEDAVIKSCLEAAGFDPSMADSGLLAGAEARGLTGRGWQAWTGDFKTERAALLAERRAEAALDDRPLSPLRVFGGLHHRMWRLDTPLSSYAIKQLSPDTDLGDAKVRLHYNASEGIAEAFGRDPEFFAFYRSLTAYEKAIQGGNSTLVISPESEFFDYLKTDTVER